MVQQPFLDVLVKNNSGKIETDIFYTETDRKQYLSFNSCHPQHTKINIPYNLARLLRTIISEEHVVQTRMQELKSFLIKQKYPLQIIEHGINITETSPYSFGNFRKLSLYNCFMSI